MGETHPSNMRLTIALLCLAAVAYSAPLGNSEMTEMFSAFKSEFNKVYETETELLQRYEMFTKNVNIINNHNENEAASAGYTMAINQFTDWTTQEFSAYLTYNGTAKKHDRIVLLDETDLATSVDWTTKGAVTPVKNQAQCGSCWAFSTTGSAEGALAIAAGLGANSLVSLSEQELVDCAGSFGNQGCNGGLMEGKITSFKDVESKSCSQLMAAVAKGPVSVAIEADQTGFQHYSTGVFSSTCGDKLDHGVLAVGYGTDGGTDYWKVKNSWGSTWGDAGYIRMAKSCDSTGRASDASTAGECGILSQPSYPVV